MIEYTIIYKGKWIGLNQLYNKNRFVANQIKTEWKATFTELLAVANIKPFTTYRVGLVYWSRMDCDNTTGGLKILVDTLRAQGYVLNDDKRYYKGFAVEPDDSLPHNTYIIKIFAES